MVVKWSTVAEDRLKKVFDYYFDVAGHKVASKIVAKIIESADSLGTMPFKAPIEKYLPDCKFVYRSLIVSKIFKVVYFINEKEECIVIATIWDCRQNPVKLLDETSIT